jgi:hypothetical protein
MGLRPPQVFVSHIRVGQGVVPRSKTTSGSGAAEPALQHEVGAVAGFRDFAFQRIIFGILIFSKFVAA